MNAETRAALDEILKASEAVRLALSDRIASLERRVKELEEAETFLPSPSNDGSEV